MSRYCIKINLKINAKTNYNKLKTTYGQYPSGIMPNNDAMRKSIGHYIEYLYYACQIRRYYAGNAWIRSSNVIVL